jgi:5-formyltetrahydrofolate cyclo-ligase
MAHLSEQKQALRQAILERLKHMDAQSREAESRSVVRRILETLPMDRTICAYAPLPTEPNITPLLTELLQRGQRLYLPAFDGHSCVFRRVNSLNELTVSSFGIPEPSLPAPLLNPEEPVIALIPGRAFDTRGGRLGRGNAGYDRWITAHRKQNPHSTYYGVAFDCQIVSEVPMEEHDAFLDGVITGRGLTKAS